MSYSYKNCYGLSYNADTKNKGLTEVFVQELLWFIPIYSTKRIDNLRRIRTRIVMVYPVWENSSLFQDISIRTRIVMVYLFN